MRSTERFPIRVGVLDPPVRIFIQLHEYAGFDQGRVSDLIEPEPPRDASPLAAQPLTCRSVLSWSRWHRGSPCADRRPLVHRHGGKTILAAGAVWERVGAAPACRRSLTFAAVDVASSIAKARVVTAPLIGAELFSNASSQGARSPFSTPQLHAKT